MLNVKVDKVRFKRKNGKTYVYITYKYLNNRKVKEEYGPYQYIVKNVKVV